MNISSRFKELVERGKEYYNSSFKKEELTRSPLYREEIPNKLYADLTAWKLSTKNLLLQIYGEKTEYYQVFSKVFSQYAEEDRIQYCKENLATARGILNSAAEDFDLGLNQKIMHILSVEFFSNILSQSKELLEKGFKDAAAILGRVIIENTLKELCNRNNIQIKIDEHATTLNELLKDKEILTLPQFKLCRSYIELGNDAAHGHFNKYQLDDVKKMFEYIEHHLILL